MKIFQLLLLALSVLIFANCTDDNSTNPDDTIESVKIGAQTWMKKNLDVDRYRNGDPIPQVTDSTVWENLKTGAWCYYNNDSTLGKIYGKLYNWYAVNDSRGLAPEGWHVPSDSDWTKFGNFLGSDVAGGKLKSTGTIEGGDGLWNSPNIGATNETGFSALPGGWRYHNGTFYNCGTDGDWWSSTESIAARAWYRNLNCYYAYIYRNSFDKNSAFSVRCIKN
jgi:uncharacterized protein (TIGR02145 family)